MDRYVAGWNRFGTGLDRYGQVWTGMDRYVTGCNRYGTGMEQVWTGMDRYEQVWNMFGTCLEQVLKSTENVWNRYMAQIENRCGTD